MTDDEHPEIEPTTCEGYGTIEWWEAARRRIEEVALWFWQYDGWDAEFILLEGGRDPRALSDWARQWPELFR